MTATVSVPAGGYTDVWLPTFGTVTGLDFGGSRADQLADDLRFNVDTNTGVLPEKLQAGDTYTVTALAQKVDAQLPKSVDVADGTVVDSQNLTFIDDKISPWTERVDGQWEKVVAVAKAMQDGAYTDGGAPGDYQNIFLPGHSLRRMTQFMKATQLAGNDEQYAAGLALAANRLGVPARVVLGAEPDANGAIKGKDVHAWVEVARTDGSWQPIYWKQFVPDRNKKPQQLIQKSEEKKTGAQVPPPAANNPPSVLQGPDQAQNATAAEDPAEGRQEPARPGQLAGLAALALLLRRRPAARAAARLRRDPRRQVGPPATSAHDRRDREPGQRRVARGRRHRPRPADAAAGQGDPARAGARSRGARLRSRAREAEPGRRRCPHGGPRPVECSPVAPGSDTEPLAPGGCDASTSTGPGRARAARGRRQRPRLRRRRADARGGRRLLGRRRDGAPADPEPAELLAEAAWRRLAAHLPRPPAERRRPRARPHPHLAPPGPSRAHPAQNRRRRRRRGTHRRPAPRALGRHEREETREAEVRPPLGRP